MVKEVEGTIFVKLKSRHSHKKMCQNGHVYTGDKCHICEKENQNKKRKNVLESDEFECTYFSRV